MNPAHLATLTEQLMKGQKTDHNGGSSALTCDCTDREASTKIEGRIGSCESERKIKNTCFSLIFCFVLLSGWTKKVLNMNTKFCFLFSFFFQFPPLPPPAITIIECNAPAD